MIHIITFRYIKSSEIIVCEAYFGSITLYIHVITHHRQKLTVPTFPGERPPC